MAKFKFCDYCGGIIPYDQVFHKNQKICLTCAIERQPDFVYNCGTFHLELYTGLMSKERLKKLIRKLPKGKLE